ncbi:Uncharacterised protein [Burkholderia pseudomallei]|uniref:phage tail protein n=1 Tax=Burkholderia pseudomallei TaxID=28450 RepID=UPI000F18611B|nr:phage tail protein [Burkholderia pseudomallei]CAJ3065966.1 Uncharacterised protein [Burkholderia pseudomallei]CAJ3073890.1 Uncharacterised protein [Burkholderia pseudomallei]CAJ3703015.1 Uncharacterised protein [Burkholderia pseudomallei]CAJ3729614.1 Uncharacterised protein [Burkholderia pseudomallei]CAJ4724679.1 Uncharacterised protein [Burkholderia pseudomallei]
MVQLAIAAVGAAAGAEIGVAGAAAGLWAATGAAMTGAEIGWMVGSMVGAMIDRPKGPNPSDIRIQDSAYGKPIPFVYGMCRVAGNIIWAGQPYISDAGKGFGKGPSQQKVSMSFAVGLCAGPITSVRRIWANGKLIFDISNPSNFQALSGSSSMVTSFTVYPGDENQEPDPTMQAALGVANTPAHRGLAYVVFNNLDLSQWGNYLPSFSFEVTTGAPAGVANTVCSYTFPSWMPISSMPYLTAQGGVCVGVDEYVWSSNPGAVTNLNAYGAVPTGTLYRAGGGLTWQPYGNSDVPGIYLYGGWLHPDNTYDDFSLAPSLSLGVNSSGSNYWRNGSDFYISSTYPGCTTLYRLQIASPATLWGAPTNPGGTLLASTSATGNGWILIGGTSSYVYAISGSYLYRLDRNTLATIASWTSAGNSAGYQVSGVGYVSDDDHIYITDGASDALWLFRPSQNTWTKIGPLPFNNVTSMAAINPTFFVFGNAGPLVNPSFGFLQVVVGSGSTTTLGAIVADICNRAGLSPSLYDVSQLTDVVQGYAVTNHAAARSNLAPLMGAYFFDACDTDGLIKFVKRGAPPVDTFNYADLGASPTMGDQANVTPITEVIAQEVDLPRSISLTYPELNSDYNPNTQRAVRALTNSNKDTVVNVPIVLAGSDAIARAQAILWSTWIGRKSFQFTTGLGYLQYEPGDVMTLQGNGESYTVRITRCQYDGQGTLIWTALLEEPDIYPNPATYTAQGGAAAGFRTQQMDYSGPTMLTIMDLPPLQSGDTSQGLYIAACGMASNWPGCAIELSRDGSSYSNVLNVNKAATMGSAATALPNFGGGNQPDELSTVSVVLYNGTLSSCAYSDFLNGLNAAYLGGELIFFRNAVQTAANTYTLSGLLRGRGGTEAAMGSHAAGDAFVLLSTSNIASFQILLTDIGLQLSFEPFLLNLYGNSPGTPVKLKPTNARVRPLSPALFVAGHGSASSTSDITLSWIRRARVNAQWLDGTDVALDESSETYTLTILNGSTVVRTVTVAGPFTAPTQPNYTYTAANITADGWSAGQTITFTVQQNSDQGVLSTSATTTITR